MSELKTSALKKLFRPGTPKLFMWNKTQFSFNECGRILTFFISWNNKFGYGFRIYILGLSLELVYFPWKWIK